MEVNYEGYPVFKGLQMPLQMMGIRGRFLVFAAIAVLATIMGFFVIYVLFGMLAASIGALGCGGGGYLTIMVKQKKGLHSKKVNRMVNVYHNIYVK